jgi:hypothetical protein
MLAAIVSRIARAPPREDSVAFDDGRVPPDNGLVERLHIRAALTRKNFLFAGSDAGGDRATIGNDPRLVPARQHRPDRVPRRRDAEARAPRAPDGPTRDAAVALGGCASGRERRRLSGAPATITRERSSRRSRRGRSNAHAHGASRNGSSRSPSFGYSRTVAAPPPTARPCRPRLLWPAPARSAGRPVPSSGYRSDSYPAPIMSASATAAMNALGTSGCR